MIAAGAFGVVGLALTGCSSPPPVADVLKADMDRVPTATHTDVSRWIGIAESDGGNPYTSLCVPADLGGDYERKTVRSLIEVRLASDGFETPEARETLETYAERLAAFCART